MAFSRAAQTALAALALACAAGVAVVANRGAILFTRPYWVDEIHTVLEANRASPAAVIGDLAAGADFGPPLVPLAAWTLRHVLGSLPPVALRTAAFVCVLAALVLIFATLRRGFSRDASAAGVAAVGANSLVVEHAFEGRFYGPWLLCAALFAWSLRPDPGGKSGAMRIAVASVLLCTVHWYGVIALAIMSTAAVATAGRDWGRALRRLAPAAAGVVAFALCIPLAIGQRRALTVATWVSDFTPSQLTVLGSAVWAGTVPTVCAAAFAGGFLVRRQRGLAPSAALGGFADPGLAALFALVAMPLAMAALSILGQPSMIARYAILTVLAWGPLAALGAESVGRWPGRLLTLWLASLWLGTYAHEVSRKAAFATGLKSEVAAFASARALGAPVVFQSMHTLYAVAGVDSVNRASMAFLDLSDSTLTALYAVDPRFQQLDRGLRVERDVVRVHARRFGFPRVVTQRDLDSTRRFVLLASDGALPLGYAGLDAAGRLLFPRHRAAIMAPSVTLFARF